MQTRIFSRRKVLAFLLVAVATLGGTVSVGSAESSAPCCPDLSGCWNGCWRSHCTGHHGKLRATLCKCGPCSYQATFSGTFFGVIPFRFSDTLTVTQCADGTVQLRAGRKLPFFGQFCMCASATCCKFTANYTAKKDRGVFVMSR